MRSFWLWFGLLMAGLTLSLKYIAPSGNELAWRLLCGTLLLAVYFLIPLLRSRPTVLMFALLSTIGFGAAALWPLEHQQMNPYPLLVFTLLVGKGFYRLPLKPAVVILLAAIMAASAPGWLGLPSLPPLFLAIYSLMLSAGMLLYSTLSYDQGAAQSRYEALLSEYRVQKRRLLLNEESARQEERSQVAREIHDSVGHKLTALLMQLEVHRMGVSAEMKPAMESLKQLAKESLEETRNAVKLLKRHEAGGLPAIMGMLRKLEVESFMRIQTSLKDGALSVQLNNRQSIAVYRAVQEALTNAMKHGLGREAQVHFEAPGGGTLFRFEVTNRRKSAKPYTEGFGLQAMRERVEQAGGELEIQTYDQLFRVRGTFPIRTQGEEGA